MGLKMSYFITKKNLTSVWVLSSPNAGCNLLFNVFAFCTFLKNFDAKITKNDEKIRVFWAYSQMLVNTKALV